jgi:hypothetical protein
LAYQPRPPQAKVAGRTPGPGQAARVTLQILRYTTAFFEKAYGYIIRKYRQPPAALVLTLHKTGVISN